MNQFSDCDVPFIGGAKALIDMNLYRGVHYNFIIGYGIWDDDAKLMTKDNLVISNFKCYLICNYDYLKDEYTVEITYNYNYMISKIEDNKFVYK